MLHPDLSMKSTPVAVVTSGSAGGACAHLKPLLGDLDVLKLVMVSPSLRAPSATAGMAPCLPPSQVTVEH